MAIIKTENLKKEFGTFKALKNVSLEVNKGEVFGFIGPNGAGKTTTIRILLGMYKPTSGNAFMFDKDCWRESVDIHKKIAFVPGDVNLWPNFTGGEVIDFLLNLNGNINKERCEKYIKRFELDVSKKCKKYSKGNRQKVALISAFALDADLYIFDEPTSGLDPLMEKVFQESVLEEKKAGKTILLSSHILSEVESLCDRISIIRKGEIIESGSLEKLRHLTWSNVELKSKNKITKLSEINGVYDINEENGNYTFKVDSNEMVNIMKYICDFDIQKIEITPLSLEELFMHYYNEE